MRTDSAIIGDAYDYIIVIFWGIGATTLYNMASCMLRAIGDSRAPLYFLIFASLLNIGLDYLCILVFRMGVAGAGRRHRLVPTRIGRIMPFVRTEKI